MNYTNTSVEFIKYFLPIFKNNNNEENGIENTKLYSVPNSDNFSYISSCKYSFGSHDDT